MATKKSTDTAGEPVVTVQFPGAFTLFKPSMQALWRNIWTIMEGVCIFGAVIAIAALAIILAQTDNESLKVFMIVLAVVSSIVALVLGVILAAGYTVLQIKSSKGSKVSLSEVYEDGKRFALRVLGINILTTLIFVGSFLLFIVPFFFMLRRYYLAAYFLVDRNLSVFEALKVSAAESKRYSSAVWGLIGVEILIGVVGYIPFVGLAVGPILNFLYAFAPAVRYVQMREAADGKIVTGIGTVAA